MSPIPSDGTGKWEVKEGQEVIIESRGQRHRAVVGKLTPTGAFSVTWWYGRNPWHPGARGHWVTDFGPGGEPRYDWRIVEVCDERE